MWPDFISGRAYYIHFGSVRSYVEVKWTNNLAIVHSSSETCS